MKKMLFNPTVLTDAEMKMVTGGAADTCRMSGGICSGSCSGGATCSSFTNGSGGRLCMCDDSERSATED